MWTESPEGHKLIREISKDIVVEIAPEELDLFDELVMEYFQNSEPPDPSDKQKDMPLASDLSGLLIAATPAIAAMVDAVLNHIIAGYINAAKGESAESVKKIVKKLFTQKKKDDKEIAPFNKEQLEQVKKLARKQAIKFGVKPDKAEKMANALIGSLALN